MMNLLAMIKRRGINIEKIYKEDCIKVKGIPYNTENVPTTITTTNNHNNNNIDMEN